MADYLPVIIGSGLFALATSIIIARNWKKIVRLLKGKQIAVLGARGVGKTHLITFLSKGSIPREYFQTLAPAKVSGRTFYLGDLKLQFRETIDVPGDQAAYGIWKKMFNEADLVFYLFRADKIKLGDVSEISRIKKDAEQIKLWMNDKKKDYPTVLLIGTFCDKDPEYISLTPSTRGTYQDKFMKLERVKQIVNFVNPEWWIFGSMENLQSTEEIAARIFKAIQALRR